MGLEGWAILEFLCRGRAGRSYREELLKTTLSKHRELGKQGVCGKENRLPTMASSCHVRYNFH